MIKQMKEWLSYHLPSVIFNIAEVLVILIAGKLLGLNMQTMIIIFMTFGMVRIGLGKATHYKSPLKCLIWSILMCLSMFFLMYVDLTLSICMAVFCGYIETYNADIFEDNKQKTKSDITDALMWKGRETKYSDIDEYVKYNAMETKLIEYEEKLKSRDNLTYLIYKYRFKDKMTFQQMSERLDMDNPRIAEKLEKIAFSFRIFFGI